MSHAAPVLALRQGVSAPASSVSSNRAILSIVLALFTLASTLLAAAAVPPVIMPSRSMAILFQRRRATIAVYGLAVLAVAGFTYAMSVLAA